MKKWLWVLLASIALVCAAFWYLNFRIAVSNTQVEKSISTTGMGIADELPDAMQHRTKISLALVDEGPLIAALQKALVMEMNNAGIADLELVQGIEPRYQSPVLIIKVVNPDLFWTPLFATSQFTVQAGYSSIGDTSFMEETPVTVSTQDGPALIMFGEYKVSDRSWGLISRPRYHEILADYLAREIVTTLKELYKVSIGNYFENPRVKQNDIVAGAVNPAGELPTLQMESASIRRKE